MSMMVVTGKGYSFFPQIFPSLSLVARFGRFVPNTAWVGHIPFEGRYKRAQSRCETEA